MRRILPILVLGACGCSTAPVADFLDRVAPGGSGPAPRSDAALPPRRPTPGANLPAPQPRVEERSDPPLPPVPSGYPRRPVDGEESLPPPKSAD